MAGCSDRSHRSQSPTCANHAGFCIDRGRSRESPAGSPGCRFGRATRIVAFKSSNDKAVLLQRLFVILPYEHCSRPGRGGVTGSRAGLPPRRIACPRRSCGRPRQGCREARLAGAFHRPRAGRVDAVSIARAGGPMETPRPRTTLAGAFSVRYRKQPPAIRGCRAHGSTLTRAGVTAPWMIGTYIRERYCRSVTNSWHQPGRGNQTPVAAPRQASPVRAVPLVSAKDCIFVAPRFVLAQNLIGEADWPGCIAVDGLPRGMS
jgi:hypothetical protein